MYSVRRYCLIKLYLSHQAISEESPSQDRTVPVGSVSSFSNGNQKFTIGERNTEKSPYVLGTSFCVLQGVSKVAHRITQSTENLDHDLPNSGRLERTAFDEFGTVDVHVFTQ